MNSRFLLFCIIGFSLWECLVGCEKYTGESPLTLYENNGIKNSVSLSQIEQIATTHCGGKTRSGEKTDCSILPFCSSKGDTLMFIVNYSGNTGWQIFSSDVRTPPVIAEGENGCFSIEEGSPALRIWLDCTAKDMEIVKLSSDDELNFNEEEISANRAYWSKGIAKVIDPPEEDGHWAVITTSERILYDTLSHMTPHWDQNRPYNAYCPYRTDSTDTRAYVGCVAVAAAGVLYYLHNYWGIPSEMVTSGYCTGDIDNFSRGFTMASTSAWEMMDPGYNSSSADAEALMLGFVGTVINMHYTNNYSWALPSNIRTDLFSLYDISCSQGSYNAATIKQNLGNGLPVIVTASDQLVPVNGDIHTFVIDGYKRTRIKYTHYHYWVPDDDDDENEDPWIIKSLPNHNPYYTYTYSTPEISMIKINWGWWTQWCSGINDGWYSLTADWTVTNNGNTYSYSHNVNMIYNLSL